LPYAVLSRNHKGHSHKNRPHLEHVSEKGSEQTYTDSGSLSMPFASGDRIAVALIVPAAGFPPTLCVLNGLNISIQFESASTAQGNAN